MFKAKLRRLLNKCPNCGSSRKYRIVTGFSCQSCGYKWSA